MHVCKGGLAGQTFALASSSDSGGRKSRIRRSKEERKSMVESFIKKYQKSNNGNFPSLNLTHKEVGGSFYTVREIVREIIQENRVLAPPKVSLEEYDHSGFLEQHPLGSISLEPEIELSEPERVHMVAHVLPEKYQISSEENITSSNGSYPLELEKEQEHSDGTTKSNHANIYQVTTIEEATNSSEEIPLPESHEFEDKKIVNGTEVLNGSPFSDKPIMAYVDHLDTIDDAVLSSEKFNGVVSQRLGNEGEHNENDPAVDKTKEVEHKSDTEAAVMETLDKEEFRAQKGETSQAVKSPMNSDVVVETFPLRPVHRKTQEIDGESGKIQAAANVEDKAIQHENKTFTRSSSGCVNEKDEKKLPDSIVELNGKNRDERVVLNVQGPSLENANYPSTSEEHSVLVEELESKVSLPDATKASICTETLIPEDSTEVGGKSSDQDISTSSKGSNQTLDRINLETWEGASKYSTRPESNPILALVKALFSSLVKFWTE